MAAVVECHSLIVPQPFALLTYPCNFTLDVYSCDVLELESMSTQLIREDLDDYLRSVWLKECGKRIRARRSELGLRLVDVERLTGVSHQTISRVETGQLAATDGTRLVLAQALAADVSELWAWPTRARVREVAGAMPADKT